MRFNHAIDGIAAATADADDFDFRAARHFVLVLNPQAIVDGNVPILLLSDIAHIEKSLFGLPDSDSDSVVISIRCCRNSVSSHFYAAILLLNTAGKDGAQSGAHSNFIRGSLLSNAMGIQQKSNQG
jgi:hypothetical protein